MAKSSINNSPSSKVIWLRSLVEYVLAQGSVSIFAEENKNHEISYTLRVGKIEKPFWKFWQKGWREEYKDLSEEEFLYRLGTIKIYSRMGGVGKTTLSQELFSLLGASTIDLNKQTK
jgi:hypothetical protein